MPATKKSNLVILKPHSRGQTKEPTSTDMLLDVIQKLSEANDLETIMYIVRRATRRMTKADGATFVLRDNGKCYYVDEDAIAPLWKGKKFPMKICISGWVMNHGEPVVIEDIYNDPRIPQEAYRVTFVKSLAMVPIRRSKPIGAIGAYWAENYRPTEEQLQFLQALADSTSIAMKNMDLYKEVTRETQQTEIQTENAARLKESNRQLKLTIDTLNRHNQEMSLLKEFSASLQTCLFIEEAYQLVSLYMEKLLPQLSGVLYIVHTSKHYLEVKASFGASVKTKSVIQHEECLALRRGAVYGSTPNEKNVPCPHLEKRTFAYRCIPLYAQGELLGLLHFEMKESLDESSQKAEEALINMLVEQMVLGLSNIQLREILRNQSLQDALTGLHNRRYCEVSFEKEISRMTRKKASLGLMMIDLDHFKQYNDNYGHDVGDLVLQSFAEVLKKFARKEDIICRYGGEEFVILIPEIKEEPLVKRAQMLHDALKEVTLYHGNTTLPTLTISIGLALFPKHGVSPSDLISVADSALYKAKNTGRNKTVLGSV